MVNSGASAQASWVLAVQRAQAPHQQAPASKLWFVTLRFCRRGHGECLRSRHVAFQVRLQCSWVQSKCGRACCAKGGGLRLRPSQLWSLLSCYRGQAVRGVTAFVTCEQRCLWTGFVCLDCKIEDSNTSWQGVRGWEDSTLVGCPARLNVQLRFCRVPLVRVEVVTLQEGASSPHKGQMCSWDTERVPPLCAFRPLVVIVLKEAFCQRAILLTQVLARHCGNVQTAVVPGSRVSALSSFSNLKHVGNSFSFSESVDRSVLSRRRWLTARLQLSGYAPAKLRARSSCVQQQQYIPNIPVHYKAQPPKTRIDVPPSLERSKLRPSSAQL